MRIPRLLIEAHLQAGHTLPVPPDTLRHAVSVLRLRDGAACRVFDGHGAEFHAILRLSGRRDGQLEIGHLAGQPTTPTRRIRLLQGIARGDHMDLAIQKAVELGVAEIWPVLSIRSLSGGGHRHVDKRFRHWEGVLRAATEQCGRNELARMAPPQPLAEALAALPAEGLRAVADPDGDGLHAWSNARSQDHPLTLLVGPEGGLEAGEIAMARAAGFRGLRLGPRILRTETAAIVGLTAMQMLFGDLR